MGSLKCGPGLRLEPKRFRANCQRHFGRQAIPTPESLRAHFRELRKTLPDAERAACNQRLCQALAAADKVINARCIAAYCATVEEADPGDLFFAWRARGTAVALPVVAAGGHMSFHDPGPHGAMTRNRYGIHEPAAGARPVPAPEIDLMLIPLVAFDDAGHRLGMGGGYYDRYLGGLAPGAAPLRVGLAFECQRATRLDPAPWDMPLDAVVTETGWQTFETADKTTNTTEDSD